MKPWMKIVLFVIGGGLLGGLYYLLFGCRGSCPITSNPYYTMAYFALVGGLVSLILLPDQPKKIK